MSVKIPASVSILVLFLPLLAWADGIAFQNSGGKITSNGTTLTVHDSTLSSITGPGGTAVHTGTLGTLSFVTGAITSGSLAAGATFAPGGSFTVVGNGTDGLSSGVLFSGTFTGPVTWTATWIPNKGPHRQGIWVYTLKGNISGRLSNGRLVFGTFVETTLDVSAGRQFSTTANISLGSANVAVPEPGTLALLSTGLAGFTLPFRRKKRLL